MNMELFGLHSPHTKSVKSHAFQACHQDIIRYNLGSPPADLRVKGPYWSAMDVGVVPINETVRSILPFIQ